MTIYARIDPTTQAVSLVDLTAEQFAALAGHPTKAATVRAYVIDAQPVAGAAQAVEFAGLVIEPTQVRKTWALRAKTQAELDADTQASELVQLKAEITALNTFIAANDRAAPTTPAQAFSDIATLKVATLRLARGVRWMLKQQG